MNAELLKLYHQFRQHSPFMLVGHNARLALDAARTLQTFRQLESDGLVRMRAEREQESYDGEDFIENAERNGHPLPRGKAENELNHILDTFGVWWTVSEYFDGQEWQHADSCGMHTGYKNPLDPFENCYVIDEMREALRQLVNHQETIIQTQLAEVMP